MTQQPFRVLVVGEVDNSAIAARIGRALPPHTKLHFMSNHFFLEGVRRLISTGNALQPHLVIVNEHEPECGSRFGRLTLVNFLTVAANTRFPGPVLCLMESEGMSFAELNGPLMIMTVDQTDIDTQSRLIGCVAEAVYPTPPMCHRHDTPAQMFRNGDVWRCGTCNKAGEQTTTTYRTTPLGDLIAESERPAVH